MRGHRDVDVKRSARVSVQDCDGEALQVGGCVGKGVVGGCNAARQRREQLTKAKPETAKQIIRVAGAGPGINQSTRIDSWLDFLHSGARGPAPVSGAAQQPACQPASPARSLIEMQVEDDRAGALALWSPPFPATKSRVRLDARNHWPRQVPAVLSVPSTTGRVRKICP